MAAALKEAQKAFDIDEVPIGCVIVYNDKIIARGHNERQSKQQVELHAEMIAIKKACKKLGSWRLIDCDIYVTLEPCLMCSGAIIQARMRNLYFGASDIKTGACGGFTDVFALKHNHEVNVTKGMMEDECSTIIKSFFSKKRIDKKQQ